MCSLGFKLVDVYANCITGLLVALVPLLCTTSSNVLCLKFGGVLETLWIFKVARWTHDGCTKINKIATVSNGIGASSFEIWTANLAQSLTLGILTNSWSFIFGDPKWKFCYVGYPLTKFDIQMRTFLIWELFNAFIFDLKLLVGVYYWFWKL